VKAFLDTSVLVATFYGEHEHHAESMALFLRQQKKAASTAAHCLAEVYAVLTRMPGKDRVNPEEAQLFLGDIRERLTVVTLDEAEYVEALAGAADCGVVGGGVYDALIARCAGKVRAEALYTWNLKHFTRLGRDIAARVKTPSDSVPKWEK